MASAAFDVVRSGEEEYTAIFAHGRGFLIYWVPPGHELVLLDWLVWAEEACAPLCRRSKASTATCELLCPGTAE